MNPSYLKNKQRITQRQKDAHNKRYYKQMADLLDNQAMGHENFMSFGNVTNFKRKKVNYDLFNNIIDVKDFQYVCQPYGAEVGDLPANMTNRDIVSGKIKVLLGMEMKMPFSWRVVAVNEEATTRKEQKEAELLRDFVTAEVMRPLRQSIEEQLLAQQKGRNLTPEEKQQLEEQIKSELSARTPDEVRKYMQREHQDPAELLAHQLLEYLIQKEKVADKFNKGWKHMNLSGEEIYYVGIMNGEPVLRTINPLYFEYDKSDDLDYIEDGEWATYEYRMSPSEVVASFGDELTDEEIDRIYEYNNNPHSIRDADFSFDPNKKNDPYTVRVLHTVWKTLRKIGFLSYYDKAGREQLKIVDENYKLNEEQGDIKIEWEWIPEAHECWKILSDIYVYARPVPGQYKDLDNLYNCKLPYYGAACDSMNSPTTSPMDRMKAYQYYYDIILYRVELLMASDKGKILAANINAVPKSAGIDTAKFQYFMEANKIAWFNPQEEGNRGMGGDVTNLVKEIDMSLASQINNYIQLAEYIERKCGEAIGVTKQMEGSISANEAVSNTKQNLIQSSHIIQPYFELHNNVKGNVLTALLETAKVAYATGRPRKLNYVLDDMSKHMLTVDSDLLDNSTYGLFIGNSSKASDAKQAVETLAQAAMQNQQADLADVMKVIRSESVTEAEEQLEAARMRKLEEEQAVEKMRIQSEERARQAISQDRQEERQHEKDMIVLKEKERRKTEIQKQTILSLGFNEDKDLDDDGEPDVLEVAKHGVDANIKERKQLLDEKKFAHQVQVDQQTTDIARKKLKIDEKKAQNSGKTKTK